MGATLRKLRPLDRNTNIIDFIREEDEKLAVQIITEIRQRDSAAEEDDTEPLPLLLHHAHHHCPTHFEEQKIPTRKKRDRIKKLKGPLCCVICMERKVSCVCIPCGHARVCHHCLVQLERMWKNSGGLQLSNHAPCSICREEIKQVWRLYT